jgi:peptidoglycan/xylan/chitin deacetylase (PgdA/CDA1 family)
MIEARAPVSPWRWRQVVRSALAYALPKRLFLVRGPQDSREVCLTFDDGPHPEHTPRLLEVLASQGVAATFFIVGQQARRYPELVRRLADEGHVVVHHSYYHADPSRTSASQLLEEIRQTSDLLSELLDEVPELFRPPHGKLTGAKLWRLWRAGQTVVLWNVDPKDYALHSVAQGLSWFQTRPLRGGDIVLFHDTHPFAAEILPELIRAARQRGLSFTTPRHWLNGSKG